MVRRCGCSSAVPRLRTAFPASLTVTVTASPIALTARFRSCFASSSLIVSPSAENARPISLPISRAASSSLRWDPSTVARPAPPASR